MIKLKTEKIISQEAPPPGTQVIDGNGVVGHTARYGGETTVRVKNGLKFENVPWSDRWSAVAERSLSDSQVASVAYAALVAFRATNGRPIDGWNTLSPEQRRRFQAEGAACIGASTKREADLVETVTKALKKHG